MPRFSAPFTQSVLIICLLWPILFLFTHLLVQSYRMDNDFGRDLVDMQAIASGDIRLLGPKLSFGGIHSGPYYYYLFAPLLMVTPGIPETVLYANAVLSWLALIFSGLLLLRLWRFSVPVITISIYIIALTPYTLFSARGPGNAFTYIPWLFPLIILWPFALMSRKWWHWVFYGIGWGVALNFHLIAGVVFMSLVFSTVIQWAYTVRSNSVDNANFWQQLKKALIQLLIVCLGVALTFTPFFLFEVTHNFVQLKNTFVDKSYQAFTNNENLPNAPQTSSNPLQNAVLLSEFSEQWLPFVWLMLVACGLALFHPKIRSTNLGIFLIASIISSVILIILARSQIAIHYFFPTYVLIQLSFLLVVVKVSRNETIARISLVGLLLLQILLFPHFIYATSNRPIERSRATALAISESVLADSLRSTPVSVYVTRETALAPQGFEYRYFLAEHGIVSLPPDAYAHAQKIIWIAEDPTRNLDEVTSWELDQFGPRLATTTLIQEPQLVVLFSKQDDATDSASPAQPFTDENTTYPIDTLAK